MAILISTVCRHPEQALSSDIETTKQQSTALRYCKSSIHISWDLVQISYTLHPDIQRYMSRYPALNLSRYPALNMLISQTLGYSLYILYYASRYPEIYV